MFAQNEEYLIGNSWEQLNTISATIKPYLYSMAFIFITGCQQVTETGSFKNTDNDVAHLPAQTSSTNQLDNNLGIKNNRDTDLVSGLPVPITLTKPRFSNVTQAVNLHTTDAWKYGGPSIADINNDGFYDMVLTNHDTTPIAIFTSSLTATPAHKSPMAHVQYAKQPSPFVKADAHGVALGDYDNDGDNDLLLALGGGNGTQPQPQRLLRNDNGLFVDVTEQSGLSKMGARGRSVRWVDLDLDGDLDFLQINAAQMMGETIPRNIIFENIGNGQFIYKSSPTFEQVDAERVIVTDINKDHIADLIAFSPYSPVTVLLGKIDFSFKDVTSQYLGKDPDTTHVTAIAQADIDNDGDMDYYLSRGKVHYQIANNAVSFNEQKKRLDLRDEGNKSHDGLSFKASSDVLLTDFYHFPRGADKITIPLFLGADKTPSERLTTGFPDKQISVSPQQALGFPSSVSQSGWYLGYLGDDQWRLEWLLTDNLAWDLRASIIGVDSVELDWVPQDLGVSDILLRNDGDHFTYLSHLLPAQHHDNNWGVITADFNNDSYNDFFIYRFGELTQRVNDVMLLNTLHLSELDNIPSSNRSENNLPTHHKAHIQAIDDNATPSRGFVAHESHNATMVNSHAHGDMGSAFDHNQDGYVDILSGDDDNGRWYLYQNRLKDQLLTDNHTKQTTHSIHHQYLLMHVGYSKSGIDPHAAEVRIFTSNKATPQRFSNNKTMTSANTVQFKWIGSDSASHSQSLKNIVHFGLGNQDRIDKIQVRWRDGSEQTMNNVNANQLITMGKMKR
ncbi:CRTAC1 family protein [Shewanella japonica]|uniref:CRTAC1 family protein n=1 Tax=Shewanella japonica TaxID=93973 RepID=UPI002493DFEC|nr:CRTAC1 family protein [Shewanella japonica]